MNLQFPTFQNSALISKWSFDFKMEHQLQNGASISKSSFAFKIELQFQIQEDFSKFWTLHLLEIWSSYIHQNWYFFLLSCRKVWKAFVWAICLISLPKSLTLSKNTSFFVIFGGFWTPFDPQFWSKCT